MEKFMFDTNFFDRIMPKLALVSIFRRSNQSEQQGNIITLEEVAKIADIPDERMEERRRKFIDICTERPYLIGGLTDFFEQTADYCECYITQVQAEEIANIPNTTREKREKRISDFINLCSMRPKMVKTVFVLGETKLGFGYAGSNEDIEVYNGIKTEKNNNIHDAMIAAAARRGDMTVVTNDEIFIKRLNKLDIPNMTYAIWLDHVSSKMEGKT